MSEETPEPTVTIGDLIIKARKAAGLEQQQLAKKADIDPSYLSKVERSRARNVTIDMIQKISGAIGCSVSALIPSIAAEREIISELEEKVFYLDKLLFDPAQNRFQLVRTEYGYTIVTHYEEAYVRVVEFGESLPCSMLRAGDIGVFVFSPNKTASAKAIVIVETETDEIYAGPYNLFLSFRPVTAIKLLWFLESIRLSKF